MLSNSKSCIGFQRLTYLHLTANSKGQVHIDSECRKNCDRHGKNYNYCCHIASQLWASIPICTFTFDLNPSNGQGQGRVRLDCKYLENSERYGKHDCHQIESHVSAFSNGVCI